MWILKHFSKFGLSIAIAVLLFIYLFARSSEYVGSHKIIKYTFNENDSNYLTGDGTTNVTVWNYTTHSRFTLDDYLQKLEAGQSIGDDDLYITDIVVNPHTFEYIENPGLKFCKNKNVSLIIYVYSSAGNFIRRNAIRNTWGRPMNETTRVKVVFVLGLSLDGVLQKEIELEAELYEDIIQKDFVDAYENLTHKGISALQWISQYCIQAEFAMKSDDDTMVKVAALQKYLTEYASIHGYRSRTIFGRQNTGGRVFRSGKYKVSSSVMRRNMYPTFCYGEAYIFSGDLIPIVYRASQYVPFLWLEDVYITGLVSSNIRNVSRVSVKMWQSHSLEFVRSYVRNANV